ncbi:MAG TPA: outer membrane beta-barrel protein [Phenylobacterium sp.]|jgi:outer membrane immunogenic protein
MTHDFLRLGAAVASFAAMAVAAPAMAQDQAAGPWTGFYVGGVAGGAWGDTRARASLTSGNGAIVINPQDAAALAATSNDKTKTGFVGGIEGGYNYQMGDWLFGVEGDWTFMDLKNSNDKTLVSPLLINPQITYSLRQNIKTDWMVSIRPRVGYVWGQWMGYATAGIAFSELKYDATFSDNRSPTDTLTASSSSTKTGWAGGLGGAYAFTPNLSLKGEWLFADFGKVGSAVTNNFVTITPDDAVKANMFRLGLDYKF